MSVGFLKLGFYLQSGLVVDGLARSSPCSAPYDFAPVDPIFARTPARAVEVSFAIQSSSPARLCRGSEAGLPCTKETSEVKVAMSKPDCNIIVTMMLRREEELVYAERWSDKMKHAAFCTQTQTPSRDAQH